MKNISGSLIRRYGTALFDCAIDASNQVGKDIFNSFVEYARILSSIFDKKISNYFANPTFTFSEKCELMDSILNQIKIENTKIPTEFSEFLKLMIENERISILPLVLTFFLAKADEHEGIARATLVSANSLSRENESEFESVLSSVLNKKIILESKVDESLRSGFIVKIGNLNVDASLRSRLLNLKESLS